MPPDGDGHPAAGGAGRHTQAAHTGRTHGPDTRAGRTAPSFAAFARNGTLRTPMVARRERDKDHIDPQAYPGANGQTYLRIRTLAAQST
ncbi:hypothetical protein ACE1SV_19700 [Streptomyces sp. E-15]